MSGETRTRLLGFLCALGGLGCSPIRETRQVTFLESSERRLAERPAPELARTAVTVTQRPDEVALRVHRHSPCWVATRQEVLTEVHTTTEPRTGWLIADAAMSTTGLLFLYGDRSEAPAFSTRGFGVVLAVVGFPSLLVDLAKFSSDTRQERSLGPTESALSRCSTERPVRHRVTVVLPDGRSWSAVTDAGGVARFPIGAALWRDFGDRVDCDLIVDGVPVRRVFLERVPP